MSSNLRDESAKYRKAARDVNLHALYRKYGPLVIIGLFCFIIIVYKFF